MKKPALLFTILILCFASINTYAQETEKIIPSTPRNYFYITPLSNTPTFQLCYERTWKNSKRGLFISSGLIMPNNFDYGITGESQYRFYLNDTKNFCEENKFRFSFHFSPFVSYKYIDGVHSYWGNYSNAVSSGILSGIKGTYGHFAFDLFVGGGISFEFEKSHGPILLVNEYNRYYNNLGLMPKMGLQLGFSF